MAAQGAAARVMLLHGMHHLWEQLEEWLKLHSAWQLTESSLLGAGFAVLSRARVESDDLMPPSSNCSWSLWAQSMRKATNLLEASTFGEFDDFADDKFFQIWHVFPIKSIDLEHKIQRRSILFFEGPAKFFQQMYS